MLIKTNSLHSHIRQPLLPVYVICGTDNYFLQECKILIRRAWRQQAMQHLDADSLDKQSFEIGRDNHSWDSLANQLQSYSLFAEKTFYQLTWNKGTLDKTAQRVLIEFAESNSTHATVVLTGNQLKAKSLTKFEKHGQIGLIPVWPLKPNEFVAWVDKLLKQAFTNPPASSAQLIARFCQNNPYAVRQVIAKLKLSHEASSQLTEEAITEQLSNQCEFQIYELSDACMEGNTQIVLQILTYLRDSPNELNLLLWVVSKDIRSLLQLNDLCKTLSVSQACQKLGIWRTKVGLYQAALKRIDVSILEKLAIFCHTADKMIKTGQAVLARQAIEQMALSLSTGKEMLVHE